MGTTSVTCEVPSTETSGVAGRAAERPETTHVLVYLRVASSVYALNRNY